MQPTPSDVHVNTPLTNISVAYIQKETAFIARRVFPVVPVMKQSDRYYTYTRADWFRDEMKRRAPGTESEGSGYTLDNTPTYYCDVWALHKDIPDQVRANEDAVLSSDRDAALWLTQKRLIRMEREFVTKYMGTSIWTTDITGVSGSPSSGQVRQWNSDTSTPIEDVKAQATAVQLLTGHRPNVLVIGRQVWDELSEHPDLVDRVKYSGGVGNGEPAKVSLQAAATLMELDEILVGNAVYDTAAEGATASNAFVIGKAGLLVYRAPAPSLMAPSGGYIFEWNGYMAMAEGQRIKTFRMEPLGSDRVEMEAAFDMKKVAADCGVYFASLVA